MIRVVIPAANWHIELANAIKNSEDGTVIVVRNDIQKTLAKNAAERMGKTIIIEIAA